MYRSLTARLFFEQVADGLVCLGDRERIGSSLPSVTLLPVAAPIRGIGHRVRHLLDFGIHFAADQDGPIRHIKP